MRFSAPSSPSSSASSCGRPAAPPASCWCTAGSTSPRHPRAAPECPRTPWTSKKISASEDPARRSMYNIPTSGTRRRSRRSRSSGCRRLAFRRPGKSTPCYRQSPAKIGRTLRLFLKQRWHYWLSENYKNTNFGQNESGIVAAARLREVSNVNIFSCSFTKKS